MPARRSLRILAPILIGLALVAGLVWWRATRPSSEELPYDLVLRGQFNYVNGEYDYGDPKTKGCVTVSRVADLGMGPLRRIGVIGTREQIPPRAYLASDEEDAAPIVAHGPGDAVFAATGTYYEARYRAWETVFVEESPGCLIEFPSFPA